MPRWHTPIHHDRSRLRQERPVMERWPARLRKASRNYKRGRLWIPASVAYGLAKTRFLTELQAQPVLNLEDFKCPAPHGLKSKYSCSMPCHKNYLKFSCATLNAQTLFKWLKHHIHSLAYISCPPDFTRHTASFNSGLSHL